MTSNDLMALAAYVGLLLLLAVPLGRLIAWIYARPADRVERWLLRLSGSDANESMDWRRYCGAFLAFSVVSFLAVYLLQVLQASLPLNPQALPNTSHHLAFNTAVSFVTNTNWQSYGGETTLSYLTQMLGLAVQNFVSAAAGIAVLVALIRGIRGASSRALGNFWSDLYRATVYLLLPLSVVLALVLVSQGTVQSFAPYVDATTLEGGKQTIALGPAASQVAIKQLGTNGGGFFNVNSAHPLENPTPFSNLLEVLAILLIPAALCLTFGRMIGDRRQGWALLAAMVVIFVPLGMLAIHSERADVAALGAASLEGKEIRFGITDSAIWATATTAASNGSVNAMHDSFTPLGGLVPMLLMQLGEVVFGGVGSGLYGMLLFAVVAVFIAGLMVGRTPEYLGKKIEAREIKLAGLAILAPCAMVLIGTALAISTEAGRATLANPGPHGFSEVLYALSSAGNNNGSAFAGLGANNPFYNLLLGVAMLVARFGVAVPVLALAGSLAGKRITPQSAGTMPTHGPLFVVLLVSIVMLVGALTFIPALALGPIVEHLQTVVR